MYKKKTIIQKYTVEGIEKFINKFSRGGKEPKMLSVIKKINKFRSVKKTTEIQRRGKMGGRIKLVSERDKDNDKGRGR